MTDWFQIRIYIQHPTSSDEELDCLVGSSVIKWYTWRVAMAGLVVLSAPAWLINSSTCTVKMCLSMDGGTMAEEGCSRGRVVDECRHHILAEPKKRCRWWRVNEKNGSISPRHVLHETALNNSETASGFVGTEASLQQISFSGEYIVSGRYFNVGAF